MSKIGLFYGFFEELDNNQSKLTEPRIKTWVAEVKKEFGI